jgi:cytochrome P450
MDIDDPDLYALGDPHALFAELRRRPGLHWHDEPDGPGFWALVRHEDAVTAYRGTDWLTSIRGILLGPNRRSADPAGGRMLVMTDPPRHTRLRVVLNRAFTPRMVQRMHDSLTVAVEHLVERALAAGRCDFVNDVAAPVPAVMINEMMGVPRADWERMQELTRVAFGSSDPSFRRSPSERLSKGGAHAQILAYHAKLLAERRRAPGDDLVSVLATAEVEGRPLADAEILLHCDNLIVGGNETTLHAAAGGLLALIEHPDQWAALRAEPDLLDSAVEEMLRWTSPAIHVMRTVTREHLVGGQTVRPGEQVVIWNISANRDEAVFPEPQAFHVRRSPNRHLTFGIGEHFCLGASLARMELRVLFGHLLSRVERVELVGPPERLRSNIVAGYKRLPVALRPR